MDNGFWTFNIGHLSVGIALATLLLALHQANRSSNRETAKRIEEGIRRTACLETKMDLMYNWFTENIVGHGRKGE